VACEISTCNEIILTELVFNNELTNLNPEEIVALLSALVRSVLFLGLSVFLFFCLPWLVC
jgi:hypothetical protein